MADGPTPEVKDTASGAAIGLEVGLTLVVAVAGCGGLGLLLDRWMAWGPWAMIGGIVLGFVAWIVDVARRQMAPKA